MYCTTIQRHWVQLRDSTSYEHIHNNYTFRHSYTAYTVNTLAPFSPRRFAELSTLTIKLRKKTFCVFNRHRIDSQNSNRHYRHSEHIFLSNWCYASTHRMLGIKCFLLSFYITQTTTGFWLNHCLTNTNWRQNIDSYLARLKPRERDGESGESREIGKRERGERERAERAERSERESAERERERERRESGEREREREREREK